MLGFKPLEIILLLMLELLFVLEAMEGGIFHRAVQIFRDLPLLVV